MPDITKNKKYSEEDELLAADKAAGSNKTTSTTTPSGSTAQTTANTTKSDAGAAATQKYNYTPESIYAAGAKVQSDPDYVAYHYGAFNQGQGTYTLSEDEYNQMRQEYGFEGDYGTYNSATKERTIDSQEYNAIVNNAKSSSSSSPASGSSGSSSQGSSTSSPAVQAAEQLLSQKLSQSPGNYQSAYSDELKALIDQYGSRQFSYDPYSDPAYLLAQQQAQQSGKLAMMDSMGQASALTGGYGSSYGQQVGQQTYNQYISDAMTNVYPELYQAAVDQYNQEGSDLLNKYSLLSDRETQDYNQYRDSVSDYYNDVQLAYNQYADQRDFGYQQSRDAVSDARYQQEYAYQASRDKVSDERYAQELALELASGSSSSGSSSSSGNQTTTTQYPHKDEVLASLNEMVSMNGDKPSSADQAGYAKYQQSLENEAKYIYNNIENGYISADDTDIAFLLDNNEDLYNAYIAYVDAITSRNNAANKTRGNESTY